MTTHANFDYDIAPLIAQLPEGWKDISWGNDACPSAATTDDAFVKIWFDYADPQMSDLDYARIDGSVKQFVLADAEGITWFQTDVWPEMVEYVKANQKLIDAYVAKNQN